MHAQKVFEEFKLKNSGLYYDLYVQSDTLLLADVFKNFWNKYIEIYKLDAAHFLYAPGLAWPAFFKKVEVELELITNNDMLLLAEKGTRGAICQAIHRYAKANNKYMNNYDKKITSSYLIYLDANNLYRWAMSRKLLVNDFEWVEDLPQFKEDFIKNYDENSDKGYLEVDVDYPKYLVNFHRDLTFLPEWNKIKKCNKVACDFHDKKTMMVT